MTFENDTKAAQFMSFILTKQENRGEQQKIYLILEYYRMRSLAGILVVRCIIFIPVLNYVDSITIG